jgi:hypothetical protein
VAIENLRALASRCQQPDNLCLSVVNNLRRLRKIGHNLRGTLTTIHLCIDFGGRSLPSKSGLVKSSYESGRDWALPPLSAKNTGVPTMACAICASVIAPEA